LLGHQERFLGLENPSHGLELVDAPVADTDVRPSQRNVLDQTGKGGRVVEQVDIPHGIVRDPLALTPFLGGKNSVLSTHGVVDVHVGDG